MKLIFITFISKSFIFFFWLPPNHLYLNTYKSDMISLFIIKG